MKKKICLVTNWYPTKENPTAGCFFKEQAFSLGASCDFIVFRYQEKTRKSPFQRDYCQKVNAEKNTVEYVAIAYIPLSIRLHDAVHNFLMQRSEKTEIGVGIYVSEKRKKIVAQKLKKLFDQAKEDVDVFYCVDGQNEAYNLQCLSKVYGKPYIIGEHAPVPLPGTLISDVNKKAIEQANLFLAISNDKIRQLLMQNIRLPKTVYIGNMIDETKFLYAPNKTVDYKKFIIVAAHSFYKNYDMFINVMNRLTELTDKKFGVMIVGYGANKGYSKDVEAFEEKIRKTKFAGSVQLIPEVSRDEIASVYNQADAFVMTSIQEGQPVSTMEAACCGLPIFSTRCGGVEDYVDDEIGRIYDVLDVEGMANGLKDYLEGVLKFNSLAIRQKVVDRFGTKEFSSAFICAVNVVMEQFSDYKQEYQ
ncbi:glycosyltransferase [Butyrivibrio sp. INlla14]|uniref:glycosyltransferase n=1 Tax=Butyrivibrio sp. INlla14 TaxID=1520808 RepID=UPI0008766B06|nr:glycosyltransferase [Butyrivibrio sp. INlla14]SCY72565.1 Glycosyltransferase involved in cell wall bisynthesis [Butyrivibrio sp. INlla14]